MYTLVKEMQIFYWLQGRNLSAGQIKLSWKLEKTY